MEGGEGSEIKSYVPVSKKPKLVSHQDPSAINDLECKMSEDESDNDIQMREDESDRDWSDELDFSSNIPLCLYLREKSIVGKTQNDDKLVKMREKIAELRSTGFKGICFYACSISLAYPQLSIFSDPRGDKINYGDDLFNMVQDCEVPERDMDYLKALMKLKDSGVDVKEGEHPCLVMQCYELMEDCNLNYDDCESCISDYFIIYESVERVKQWRSLQTLLLGPYSKGKHSEDSQSFNETLMEDYPLIYGVVGPKDCGLYIDYGVESVESVFEAVVKWWTSGSEKDEERVKTLIEKGCKKALEDHDDRLKKSWTQADYIKLKFDVARVAGILQVPDEIANFRLPGHYIWNASKSTFDPLPFE